MADPVAATIEWLASTGAPNWVVIVALLTHPSVWSDEAVKRLRPMLNRVLPAKTE
jgi:hypothetical protein